MMSLPRPFLGFFPGAVCRLEIPTVQMTTVCLAPELLDSELSVCLQRPRSRPQGEILSRIVRLRTTCLYRPTKSGSERLEVYQTGT